MSAARPHIAASIDQQGPNDAPSTPPAPAEACTEVGFDEGEPLTGAEALKFWIGVSVPAAVAFGLFALALWVCKP